MAGEQQVQTADDGTRRKIFLLGGNEARILLDCAKQLFHYLAESTAYKILEKKKLEEEMRAYQDNTVQNTRKEVIKKRLEVEKLKLDVEEQKLKAEKRRLGDRDSRPRPHYPRPSQTMPQAQPNPTAPATSGSGNIAAETPPKSSTMSEAASFTNRIRGIEKLTVKSPPGDSQEKPAPPQTI